MPAEERGPSWWDVAAYVDGLTARYHVTVELLLVPNVRRDRGAPEYAWVACVRTITRGQGQVPGPAAQHRYGKGGSWATAPSALHACLRDVEAALEARSARSAAQQPL